MSSSEQSPSPSRDHHNVGEVARLKRQLAAAEVELKEVAGTKARKPPTTVTLGRGIRRLVTMFDSLEAIMDHADNTYRQKDNDLNDSEETDEEISEGEAEDKEHDSRCKLGAYAALLQEFPIVRAKIENDKVSANELYKYLNELQKGANDARSDDLRRIKEEAATWLNTKFNPISPFNPRHRNDRGIQNDITGRLLCPIEYDWDDLDVRRKIREGVIDISEDYFLRCFYPHGRGDPNNVEEGFLRSILLVKTFCAVFTSPSSSDSFNDDDDNGHGPARKQQRTSSQKKVTRGNVATILRMDGKVTPRSIAYAAVLLAFNLTNADHWVELYNQFSFRAFYDLIVDFFEPEGKFAEKRAKNLLKWWNAQIFPNHITVSSNTRKSRNKLASQRFTREESLPL